MFDDFWFVVRILPLLYLKGHELHLLIWGSLCCLCFQTKKKECWSIYTWEMFKLQLLRLERLLNCKLSERRLYCHNVKSTKMEDWKDQSQGCIPAAIPCYKCEFWYIYFDPIISSPGLISFCQIILPFYQSCLCSISEHNSFLQRRLNLLH